VAAIRTAAVANASSPWLVFWNALPYTWPQRRLPTAAELDRVAPGRRVLVSVRDLHRVAASSASWPSLGWAPRPVGRGQTSRVTGAEGLRPLGLYAGARPCPVGKFGWCTEVAPSEAAREPKAGGRTWLLPILLTAVFMTTADNSIVNVAVPSIAVGLRASGGELELAVSAYILAYAVLLVTGARLGSIYGYRRAFLAGLALFTLGSLACGLGPNAVALILARIVQGIGAAIMVPQVLTDIQLSFEGTDRARAA